MAIFSELPISFPWYQRKEHQNRYKANVAGRPDLPGGYKPIDLICPYDAVLPFEFYISGRVAETILPTFWAIYRVEDDVQVQVIPLNQLLSTYLPNVNRKYFYHAGNQQNIHLGNGEYYSRIDFTNGFQQFSEVFHVCNFSVNQLDCPFLKLQWWNDSDINPIFYNDFDNGRPRFTNVVYLDTFIHEYEVETIQETFNEEHGKPIASSSLANLKYRIAILVPSYLKKALVLTQIHDWVFLTTSGIEHRTGEIENIATSSEALLNGAFHNFEIVFEDEFLFQKSCGENMT